MCCKFHKLLETPYYNEWIPRYIIVLMKEYEKKEVFMNIINTELFWLMINWFKTVNKITVVYYIIKIKFSEKFKAQISLKSKKFDKINIIFNVMLITDKLFQ